MARKPRYWYILIAAMAFLWILFKCCYPYADFFSDSYTYIQSAVHHDRISYRPIGYSLFLRLVHGISGSDTVLVTIQYVLIQASCLSLFSFLIRRCKIPGRAQVWIAVFLALDLPVFYISNYVSSDALFFALSLFWFTELLQLMNAPTWRGLLLQWVLLALIFYTRYVALFYPVAAAFCFLWLPKRLVFRLTAIAGSFAIVVTGIYFTRQITREETGAPTFSAFSGWQAANNALHIYPWLPTDTSNLPSPATRQLAVYVGRYFDREGDSIKKSGSTLTTAYMWENGSPLHQYMDDYQKRNSPLRERNDTQRLSYFDAWHRVAPVFSEYGYSLMRQHPVAFSRYYLWNSAKDFFLSPLDVFAVYNEGRKEVDPVARDWFGYRSARPVVRSATIQAKILAPFPWLSLLLGLSFLLTAGLFLVDRELRTGYPVFTNCLRVAAVYLAVNACFNIVASPTVYRYQVLPTVLLFIFTVSGLFFVTSHKLRKHAGSANRNEPALFP